MRVFGLKYPILVCLLTGKHAIRNPFNRYDALLNIPVLFVREWE